MTTEARERFGGLVLDGKTVQSVLDVTERIEAARPARVANAALELDEIWTTRCTKCGAVQWPPKNSCSECGANTMEAVEFDCIVVVSDFTPIANVGDALTGATASSICTFTGWLTDGVPISGILLGITAENAAYLREAPFYACPRIAYLDGVPLVVHEVA